MRFIFDSSPHHCPQHMCRGPRGEGRPSQSGGREDLRSERSAIEVGEVGGRESLWSNSGLGFNLIMLMLSGFTI